MNTPRSTYGRALSMLAACPYFIDGRVLFDPSDSAGLPAGLTPAPDDPEAGFSINEVPKDTDPATEGPFMILGHVLQPDLGIPPAAYVKGGQTYTIDPNKVVLAYDNVGNLDAQFAKLDEQAKAGHPLGNRDVKYGPNLVAFADAGSGVAVLIWSRTPYTQRQVNSQTAD